MESNMEIKEESVECGQRHIDNRLSTSSDVGDLKNGLKGNSDAVKAEIKKEFVEGDTRYLETQVSTSLDLRDFKNEPDEYNTDRRVKAEIKEEFFEVDPGYIESQLSTAVDLEDIKNDITSDFNEEENTT
ncbi:uncharacterized protein LOC114345046 isoform X5 [Diabrotica virgifera virgifera]|nr:uncharacterized protein LOC114345046 isoform X5 [Diabrotica virgifera virgifera]